MSVQFPRVVEADLAMIALEGAFMGQAFFLTISALVVALLDMNLKMFFQLPVHFKALMAVQTPEWFLF